MKRIILILVLVFLFGCEPEPSVEESKKEALEFLDSFVDTWAVKEDVNKLNDFFSDGFFTISPIDSFRQSGLDKNIQGYKKFLDNTDILDYEIFDKEAQIYNKGKCAVVSWWYTIRMNTKTDTINTSGRDMFVLIKNGNRWEMVANHFSNFPK